MTTATKRLRRSGLAGLAALATVGGALVVTAGSAGATSTATITNIAGADRYATAATLATKAFATSANVVLASGDAAHFPDALAGNYLAGQLGAPILLTTNATANLPAATLTALGTLKPTTVYVLGDTNAVPASQETQLTTAGYTVVRLGGANRFETDKLVAERSGLTAAGSIAGVKTAIVANSQKFPDALSAGPLAYASKLPVVITPVGSLDTNASAILTDLGIKQVIIVGDNNSISQATQDQIKALGITILFQAAGTSRSDTSAKLADWEMTNAGFIKSSVTVATGDNSKSGADALAAGPFAGSTMSSVLVTNSTNDAGSVISFLTAHAPTLTNVNTLGQAASIPAAITTAITNAVQGGTANQSLTVTPAVKATNIVSSDTGNTGSRSYTVTGLDNTKTYTIQLSDAANVKVSSTGNVTFLTSGGPTANKGVAIEVVNGAPQAALAKTGVAGTVNVNVSPVGGQITFSVDAADPNAIVPVVYLDSDSSGTLTFATAPTATVAQAPAESFGIGGETDWNPSEAPSGNVAANDTIKSADTTAKTIVGTSHTYKYDSNDLFYVDDDNSAATAVKPADQVSLANFEKVLTVSGGDVIEGTSGAVNNSVYQQDASLQSTFVLENLSPLALGTPTVPAATIADTNAIISIPNANLVSGATVKAYLYDNAGGAASFANAKVNASSTTDADSTSAGTFEIKVTGLVATHAYTVYVTQTVASGEESSPSSVVFTAAATPPATDTALKLSSVTVNDVNDGVTPGTAAPIILTFNKAITSIDCTKINVSPTSQPGIKDAGTGAATLSTDKTQATCALTTGLNDASTDVAYTVTVPAGAVVSTDGTSVNAAFTGTFSY